MISERVHLPTARKQRARAAAIARWAGLLRAGGRLVLIEGLWSTGAGVRARDLEALVRPIIPNLHVEPLTDDTLWGENMTDERYMLVART